MFRTYIEKTNKQRRMTKSVVPKSNQETQEKHLENYLNLIKTDYSGTYRLKKGKE